MCGQPPPATGCRRGACLHRLLADLGHACLSSPSGTQPGFPTPLSPSYAPPECPACPGTSCQGSARGYLCHQGVGDYHPGKGDDKDTCAPLSKQSKTVSGFISVLCGAARAVPVM